jgi:hypothetical protein
MAPIIMARGPNFVYAKEYIRKEYGEHVWDAILANLSDRDVIEWVNATLVTGLYPFSAFKAMTAVLAKELNSPEDAEIARMYEYIADRSLNVIHKMFFKVASPSFVISNYPQLWRRFFTTGKVEVPIAQKGHATLKFTLPGIFLDWLPPACLGYSTKAVEMAGGSNLTQQETTKTLLSNGDWEIVYELNWEEG